MRKFIEDAKADRAVYISDVRARFFEIGSDNFALCVIDYDRNKKLFNLPLPNVKGEKEILFIKEYIHATIYNIISATGALGIEVYRDGHNSALVDIAAELNEVFQLSIPKAQRFGYGKCLNVNERIVSALFGDDECFKITVNSIDKRPDIDIVDENNIETDIFSELPQRTKGRLLMGMDIGGTDIKIAVSYDDRLILCKEYDWYPASFKTAEQLIQPIVNLTRLMRVAAGLVIEGKGSRIPEHIMSKESSDTEIITLTDDMERQIELLRSFDGIGLCFPDVVIKNKIVGGETFKTKGMRENAEIDYEIEFSKITPLADMLKAYVTSTGDISITNDGPMAAFTAAVEYAADGVSAKNGFFAHTLGTELGTGWVLPTGTIPEIPLEVYNFIIDLGSYSQRSYLSGDVRSILNFNTELPGTLQKCICQYGVFRLALNNLAVTRPDILSEAVQCGVFIEQGGEIVVPTAPIDMRKAALEFFMELATHEDEKECREIFATIGEYIAVTYLETELILGMNNNERVLFGRLVKNNPCFKAMQQGAARICESLTLKAADTTMANTTLMQQLDNHPEYTVAQFAQAVGAIYFAVV